MFQYTVDLLVILEEFPDVCALSLYPKECFGKTVVVIIIIIIITLQYIWLT